jgi:hypothetical protein
MNPQLWCAACNCVLIATVKKELQFDTSFYTLLQTFPVVVFEKSKLSSALRPGFSMTATKLRKISILAYYMLINSKCLFNSQHLSLYGVGIRWCVIAEIFSHEFFEILVKRGNLEKCREGGVRCGGHDQLRWWLNLLLGASCKSNAILPRC